MRIFLVRPMATAALSLAGACAGQPRATVQAASVERMQCDSSSTSQDHLVRSIAVLQVQPPSLPFGPQRASAQSNLRASYNATARGRCSVSWTAVRSGTTRTGWQTRG